jgi:hypothetical protein
MLLYHTHNPASAEAEPGCIMHERLFVGCTRSHGAYVDSTCPRGCLLFLLQVAVTTVGCPAQPDPSNTIH